jgi:molybdopterin-containing oxidoreductase family iron-sulfur binding subunit
MEKCTFCVQRIRRAKWQMREDGRDHYEEDDVVTACEEACPAGAIEFGSIHSGSDHQVRDDHENPRAVSPLTILNVGSSVAYLSDIRNTDRALAPATGHHDAEHGGEKSGSHGGGHDGAPEHGSDKNTDAPHGGGGH